MFYLHLKMRAESRADNISGTQGVYEYCPLFYISICSPHCCREDDQGHQSMQRCSGTESLEVRLVIDQPTQRFVRGLDNHDCGVAMYHDLLKPMTRSNKKVVYTKEIEMKMKVTQMTLIFIILVFLFARICVIFGILMLSRNNCL